MLAKKYSDYKDRISFPVFCQPKLDGMRCIAKADGLWSREGKPINSAPHVYEALKPAFQKWPELVLDGELYADKFKNDFNKIISLAKKQKPTAADLQESAEHLQYWVYDCLLQNSPQYFVDRHSFLVKLFTGMLVYKEGGYNPIQLLETFEENTQEGLDNIYGKWLTEGFEGQIIRLNALYEHKRTSALLKRKEFQDQEYPIVDVLEGVGNRQNMAAKTLHKLPDGRTFKAGIVGNTNYCRKLLQEKKNVIGKMGTVVYFNLTPDGVPRFPKLKGVRDYEQQN